MKQDRYICLILVVLFLIGCQSPPSETVQPYKFGGVLQLTGPQSFYGTLVKYGIELAVEDINQTGGINGRPVVAIFEDSAGDKSKAATATQKLINIDHVDALFTIHPHMAAVVAPLADEYKIPYIYIGSVNTFAENRTYVFKDYPSPIDLCEKLMKKAVGDGHKQVALFGTNDETTWLCKEGAEKVAPINSFEMYSPGEIDFRTQFTKIKSAENTAILLYGLAGDCPHAYKQLQELGITSQLYLPIQSWACGNTANTQKFRDLLANAFGSDISLDEQSTDPRFLYFKRRLEERNWAIHPRGSALEYDIVMEMAKAYEGCTDTACVADHLRSLDMVGITGRIRYNGGQIVSRDIMLTRFENGTWVKA